MLKYRIIEGKNLKKDNMIKNKTAFTLAEVLITLGIIGVVAALIIPFVTTQYQKKVMASALMQSYNQINNAIRLVSYSDYNGHDMSYWNDCGSTIYSCFYKVFNKMNGAKLYPEVSDVSQVMCYEGRPYKEYKYVNTINGKDFSTASRSSRMPNGACVLYHASQWAGDARGTLYIDVNGPYKGPNEYGKDLFKFLYIIPNSFYGIIGNGFQIYPAILAHWDGTITNRTASEITRNYCYKRGNSYNFYGCAAKIMMDGWQIKSDYPW